MTSSALEAAPCLHERITTASERITEEVTSWPEVEAGIGRRGEYGFTVGGRQLGHLHGDHAAHFGFLRRRLNYDRTVARHGLPEEVEA